MACTPPGQLFSFSCRYFFNFDTHNRLISNLTMPSNKAQRYCMHEMLGNFFLFHKESRNIILKSGNVFSSDKLSSRFYFCL